MQIASKRKFTPFFAHKKNSSILKQAWTFGDRWNVLLPYRFTLFSNRITPQLPPSKVLLPYRFKLFSNLRQVLIWHQKFYYLIDLHYSQTMQAVQTRHNWFYYLIDLHYSQTVHILHCQALIVLLPYRFTLFSNRANYSNSIH